MPTEYSHLPSSPITDVLPWEGDTKKFGSQWPVNWVKNNQQVNGRDVWGKTHWKKHTGKKIYDTDQSKCISIGHVSVH